MGYPASEMTVEGKFVNSGPSADDRAGEMMGSLLSGLRCRSTYVAQSRLSTIIAGSTVPLRGTSLCVGYFAVGGVTEAMIQSQANGGAKTILLLMHVRMYKKPYYELAVERTTSTEP